MSPDRIRPGTEKGGRKSAVFEKRVNGLIEAVEIVASDDGRLLNMTMWKRPSAAVGDAQSETVPANTSESAAAPCLYQNIGDFLNKSKASQAVDANGEPLVVYHGTGFDIDRMRKPDPFPANPEPSPFWTAPRDWYDTREQFYFTSSPDSAK